MRDEDVDPARLAFWPINAVDPYKANKLFDSLRARGWDSSERRLLVEELDQFRFPWTGTHRSFAAWIAGLRTVPCRVIEQAEANRAFESAGYDLNGWGSWRGTVTGVEGPMDKHRLSGLKKAGLLEAAAMVQEEIDSEEW